MSSWVGIIQAVCAMIALVISGLGTYFVVKSFRHQVKVNREQANINEKQTIIIEQQIKMNEFEIARSKREIRPVFMFLKSSEDYEFLLKKAIARNICVNVCNIMGTEVSKGRMQNVTGWPEIYIMKLTQNELQYIKDKNYHYEVTFEDEDGTKYRQTITNGERIIVGFPEVI